MKHKAMLLPCAMALAVAAQPCMGAEATQQVKKKNVILIITDDMRLDMTGFGGGVVKTPNLDALSKESVQFQSACTTTGLSSPSRAALFTGRLGHRTGLEDNLHLWRNKYMTLPAEETTIYEWASEQGYNVGYFGKWHVGIITPADRGIIHSEISKGETLVKKPAKPGTKRISGYYNHEADVLMEKPEYYSTQKVTYEKTEAKKQVDLGIKFLEQSKGDDRPMFLTVSFHSPHPPYKVPAPYDKMYDHAVVNLPESYKRKVSDGLAYQHEVLWPWMDVGHMSDNDWRKTISYSWGMCTLLDRAIGEFLDAVKEAGLWDDSMIIFTSDQGSMLAEHTLYDKGPYAYDGLMRIPLIVKAPGVKAKKVEHQVSLIDLNETMVEYMGIKPNQDNIDSRSLLPLIEKGDKAWKSVPDVAFYRYEYYNGHWFGVRTIRTPQYKYSFNPVGDDELYDLKNDPHEMKNLIASPQLKSVKQHLQAQLRDHLKSSEDIQAYRLMMNYVYQVKM